jgi:hypothetical protein
MADSKDAATAKAKKDQRAREGAAAMAAYEANAIAVRQNMTRLREMRLAREAEELKNAPAKPAASRSSKKTSSTAKQKPKALSDWLKNEQDSGRNT